MKNSIVELADTYKSMASNLSISMTDSLKTIEEQTLSQTLEDKVDMLMHLDTALKAIESLRKAISKAKQTLERQVCIQWVATNNPDPIRTELVTASPNVAVMTPIPKKGTEDYDAFCTYFEIPDEVKANELFRPYWPSLKNYFEKCGNEGKPLPEGINMAKAYNVFSVSLRRRPKK